MPYSTTADLLTRLDEATLIRLTDRATPPAGAIDQAVIDDAIADADAVIDAHLATKYTLPLAETPALVKSLARDIVVYKLHIYVTDEKIETDYKMALRKLEQIASGALKLPIEDGSTAAETGGTGARTTDRKRPMTQENMRGLI